MKYYLFLISSLVILTMGLGHLTFEFFQNILLGHNDPQVERILVLHYIKIFGFERSLNEFMHGFSTTMGVFMVFYGALNLLLVVKFRQMIYNDKLVNLLNAFLCLIVFIISCIFFHWPPIIFFFIAFISYLFVGLTREKYQV